MPKQGFASSPARAAGQEIPSPALEANHQADVPVRDLAGPDLGRIALTPKEPPKGASQDGRIRIREPLQRLSHFCADSVKRFRRRRM